MFLLFLLRVDCIIFNLDEKHVITRDAIILQKMETIILARKLDRVLLDRTLWSVEISNLKLQVKGIIINW